MDIVGFGEPATLTSLNILGQPTPREGSLEVLHSRRKHDRPLKCLLHFSSLFRWEAPASAKQHTVVSLDSISEGQKLEFKGKTCKSWSTSLLF